MATSSIPVACALPPDPNFGGSNCKTTIEPGKHIKTCCWTEQGTGGLIKLRVKYCQTCTTPSGGETTCDQKELQVIGKAPTPDEDIGVLQDPSADSGPKLQPKGGFSLGPNMKFSQANTTSSNDTTTQTLEHLNVDTNETDNETMASGPKEEQDEGEITEEDDSEQSDEDN